MSDRKNIQRKKGNTSTIANPSLASSSTPTLATPSQNLSSSVNTVVADAAVRSISRQQDPQSTNEPLPEAEAFNQEPLGHDLSRISLRSQSSISGRSGDPLEPGTNWTLDRLMRVPKPGSFMAQRSELRFGGHDLSRMSIEPVDRVEPSSAAISPSIQRQCAACEEEELPSQQKETAIVQRHADRVALPEIQRTPDLQRAPDKMPPKKGKTEIINQSATITASGKTLTEAITNLTSQGKGEAGSITCQPTKDTQAYSDDKTPPTVVEANIVVTETKAMPVWTELDRQCEPVKREWNRFYQALDTHENGHLSIDKKAYTNLHLKLLGKSPADADTIFNSTETQANTDNDAYDAKTQHGLTQGTGVNPVGCGLEKVGANTSSGEDEAGTSDIPSSDPTTVMAKRVSPAPAEDRSTGHDLSRISMFSVQAKLTVSQPNDPYEQEADRVAGAVMRMQIPESSEAVARRSIQETISRKSAAGEGDELVRSTSMLHRSGDNLQVDNDLEGRLNNSKGGGSPLADDVRSFMEPRFGADFSGVRVHTGSDSVRMNQDVNAQAFAHGSDIYFGAGKAPGNNELMAHELTHVVQQTGGMERKCTVCEEERVQSKLMPAHAASCSSPLVIQKFESSEHKVLGDEGAKTPTGTVQTVELAKDYFVSFGDITAMAGDYFGSVNQIGELAKNEGQGKGTREEIEYVRVVKIHGHKDKETSFSEPAREAVMERYYKLAGNNTSHFTQPEGEGKTSISINNFGSYHDNHENAIKLAATAGATKASINGAMLQEGFASHFLTDAFSGGHIRTERLSISEWWNPRVPMFWTNLKLFIAEEMAYYINDNTAIAGALQTVQQLWESVREILDQKKLPSLTFGDLISGAVHDYDNEKGVATDQGVLVGDGQLRDDRGNPIINKATGQRLQAATVTENAAINAVRLSIQEIHKAYELGATTSPASVMTVLGVDGSYTAEKILPKAKPDTEQANERTKWQQPDANSLLTDTTMKDAIAIFARGKAQSLEEAITFEDVKKLGMTLVSAGLQSKGFQERVTGPLKSNPIELLTRIINYTPNTGGGVGGHDTDDNALEYFQMVNKEGALGTLTQVQRVKLIRDLIGGICGDDEEQAINKILEHCSVSDMTNIVKALGGGNAKKGIEFLDSGIDGSEWKDCENLLKRSPELAKEL
jgi:Domain of unknown function (DUF4157)/Bacterial protein of unknown function (DUF922)